ncbi:DUF2291 family protein [Lentzea sp. NPDC058436]|uniref:DUF2291 family protein n=1 Tax=Lentzea sp. NPDC058436 TaxID=3346499 RepID=UPI00366643CF
MSALTVPGSASGWSRRRVRQVAGPVAVLLLVVVMALDTRFLTRDEVAALAPKPFDPAASSAELWNRARGELPGTAVPLAQVVQALQTDVKAAAASFKAATPNQNAYAFPVTVEGVITEAGDSGARVQVDGVPAQTAVTVAAGPALNGSVVRDAMGFTFAQAPDQTRFQQVGDELRKLMTAELQKAGTLAGKKVKVVGVMNVVAPTNTVPPAKPVVVQPITVEVVS